MILLRFAIISSVKVLIFLPFSWNTLSVFHNFNHSAMSGHIMKTWGRTRAFLMAQGHCDEAQSRVVGCRDNLPGPMPPGIHMPWRNSSPWEFTDSFLETSAAHVMGCHFRDRLQNNRGFLSGHLLLASDSFSLSLISTHPIILTTPRQPIQRPI